jgi:hypothetical protein
VKVVPAPTDAHRGDATAPRPIAGDGDVEVLRRLVEGTVRSTGEEFFRSLVRDLSLAEPHRGAVPGDDRVQQHRSAERERTDDRHGERVHDRPSGRGFDGY